MQTDCFFLLFFFFFFFFFLYFCIKSSIRLASCKSALNPSVVYSADRSMAVVPVLVLFFVAL